MSPPSQVPRAGITHRMLRILLVIAFILEVDAALSSFARANSLARFMLRLQVLDAPVSPISGSFEVPSTARLFIWACLAVALYVWGNLHGQIRGLLTAWEAERPWVDGLRGFWRTVALGSVGGEVLLVVVDLLARPGLTVLGAKLACALSMGLATTFFLAVVLLEQEPVAPAAALPERPERPAPAVPAPATPRPPAPAPSVPAPAPLPAPGQCAVCGEAIQGPRCTGCGAAVLAGGFRVVGVLAQNAHARTYLTLAPDGTKAVLKEMSFALMPDDTTLAAFEREGQLLEQLRHARVPRFLARFTEGQGAGLRFYVAYAYVEGVSLAAELQRQRYTEEQALELTRSVLRVLAYLHALSPPVVHRDIKPANLLRRPDGVLVLVDFGSARELSRTTHQATMVGTVGYMPREQLAGQVDVTSDLYALGMTVLHLLTRKAPWEMLDETGRLVFPRQLPVSPGLRRVLQQLTAPQRKERFASAREALRALDAPAPNSHQSPWLLGAAAASLLLLVVGGTLLEVRGRARVRSALNGPTSFLPATVATPPPADESAQGFPSPEVLARFTGGEVSEDELRERTARMPARMRGGDSNSTRRLRLEVLVREKLLAREAERTIALEPAWRDLPEALQLRHRLRALVEARLPAETPPDAQPVERLRVIRELGSTLADAARVELNLARLDSLNLAEPAAPHWRDWELQGAREALKASRQSFVLQYEPLLARCGVDLVHHAATSFTLCGCDVPPDRLLDDEVLYFDLYLSGAGPNVLFTHNSTAQDCQRAEASSTGPADEMALRYFVSLTPRVLSAPEGTNTLHVEHLLHPLWPLFGICLDRHASADAFEGSLDLSWNMKGGVVRELSVVHPEFGEAADLAGTEVNHCLRTLLEPWRLVTAPPGAYTVRFQVSARRQLSSDWTP